MAHAIAMEHQSFAVDGRLTVCWFWNPIHFRLHAQLNPTQQHLERISNGNRLLFLEFSASLQIVLTFSQADRHEPKTCLQQFSTSANEKWRVLSFLLSLLDDFCFCLFVENKNSCNHSSSQPVNRNASISPTPHRSDTRHLRDNSILMSNQPVYFRRINFHPAFAMRRINQRFQRSMFWWVFLTWFALAAISRQFSSISSPAKGFHAIFSPRCTLAFDETFEMIFLKSSPHTAIWHGAPAKIRVVEKVMLAECPDGIPMLHPRQRYQNRPRTQPFPTSNVIVVLQQEWQINGHSLAFIIPANRLTLSNHSLIAIIINQHLNSTIGPATDAHDRLINIFRDLYSIQWIYLRWRRSLNDTIRTFTYADAISLDVRSNIFGLKRRKIRILSGEWDTAQKPTMKFETQRNFWQ